jgi:hypothetical protein
VFLSRAGLSNLEALDKQGDKLWALHAMDEPMAAVRQLLLDKRQWSRVATVAHTSCPVEKGDQKHA